ncbi:universal stress protein [Halobacteriaceae archaeon GCM10025711]
MYDDILVPTDGSPGTDRTLANALEIATDQNATVHALYVVDRRVYLAAADEGDDVKRTLTEEGEDAVASVAAAASDAGLDSVTEIRDGVPHKEILEYADEAGIDLIAMGTHGRTGRDRLTSLGSCTETVVENATVPVLTVHIDAE